MLLLQNDGYGVEQGIPTLMMAACSFDDILAITGFTTCLGMAFATGIQLMWFFIFFAFSIFFIIFQWAIHACSSSAEQQRMLVSHYQISIFYDIYLMHKALSLPLKFFFLQYRRTHLLKMTLTKLPVNLFHFPWFSQAPLGTIFWGGCWRWLVGWLLGFSLVSSSNIFLVLTKWVSLFDLH